MADAVPELARVTWHAARFDDLPRATLYALLRLRAAVFIVEQTCVFQDPDGRDALAWHVWGEADGEVVAVARWFPPGVEHTHALIGRVATDLRWRRTGVGRGLMAHSMRHLYAEQGEVPIYLWAQAYLRRFYESFGFVAHGEPQLEDGILHYEMTKP